QALETDSYFPMGNDYIINYFKEKISNKPTFDGKTDDRIKTEYNLMKKYKDEIISYLDVIRLVGDSNLIYFENEIPIKFATYKDELLILFSAGYSNVYNTNRTNSKERAKSVLNSIITALSNPLYNRFEETDIKYYGIAITYGCKDFSYDLPIINPETLIMVGEKEIFKQYYNLEITDKEFIKKAALFINDKDMGLTDLKRTEL
ncbi:MAG: hypothetical protein ACOC1K_02615, partial [Nanoarchaeota archaeon]